MNNFVLEEKLEKKLILLVEDEEILGRETAKLIESFKDENDEYPYKVIWVPNGLDALKFVKKHQRFFGFAGNDIDCILLDLRMPIMDGPQFFKKFRQLEKRAILSPFTPVIYLTAYEDDGKWASGIKGGIADYIRKPVSREELKTKLKLILDNKDAEIITEATRLKGLEKRDKYYQANQNIQEDKVYKKPLIKKRLKKLILLVEDEEISGRETAKLIKNIKDDYGREKYNVIWAKDGIEAFKVLKKNRRFIGFADNKVKCIILDFRMPNMDGKQFLKRLRRIEERRLFSRYIPVVILTAYDSYSLLSVAKHNMVSEFLRKPISPQKLEHTLNKIFEEWDPELMADLLKSRDRKNLDIAIRKAKQGK